MKNPKFSEKDRALRSQIRMKISNLRSKLKDLQGEFTDSSSKDSEIEICKGEIEVLRKELQSLEDGGHTTFIKAKKMLEPKKNLSSKSKKLEWKTKILKTRLKSAEKKLKKENASEKLIETQNGLIQDLKKQLLLLEGEKQALKSYNHTRFLESKGNSSMEDSQEKELAEVKQKILTVIDKISKFSDNDSDEVKNLKEELHLLEMEKESIENFTHDHFLKNLESMKAKRKSALQ